MAVLVSTAYLPPISQLAIWVQKNGAIVEAEENFEKQSYRNRCVIFGPNGLQNLTVPVMHTGGKTPIKELKVSYAENWPAMHWRSLVTAYKGRPFFDILGTDIKTILDSKPAYLLDLNTQLLHVILDWLQCDVKIKFTDKFAIPATNKDDFRFAIHPKKPSVLVSPPPYFQHFANPGDFSPDLSVIDLIFTEGRASWDYLNELDIRSTKATTPPTKLPPRQTNL